MTTLALFEEKPPLRQAIASLIMPAAFSENHDAPWKKGAQRRTLALADAILELVQEAPISETGAGS